MQKTMSSNERSMRLVLLLMQRKITRSYIMERFGVSNATAHRDMIALESVCDPVRTVEDKTVTLSWRK